MTQITESDVEQAALACSPSAKVRYIGTDRLQLHALDPPLNAQPVEHGRGSNYRQETVRKLAHQAGQP